MEVIHQAEHERFVVQVGEFEALLEYHLLPRQGVVDFHHTFVPPQIRGRGIAEKLVRTGLAWARTQQLKIEASCSYVRKFLR